MKTFLKEVGGRVYGFKRNEDDTITPFDPMGGEEFPPLRKKVSGELWKVSNETGCHSLSWIVNFYFGTGGEIKFNTKQRVTEQKCAPKEILLAPPKQISDQELKKLISQTGQRHPPTSALLKPVVEAVMMNLQVLIEVVKVIQKGEQP